MSLAPLLNANALIQVHSFAAMFALVIGTVQMIRAKGTLSHRTLGWIWLVIMVMVAVSSFGIHELKIWQDWSPIHLLSLFTLASLPLVVIRVRQGNIQAHKRVVLLLFFLALVGAGLFTLLPGRLLHISLFGS